MKIDITAQGWIKKIRKHGNIIFLDLVNATGTLQAICSKEIIGDTFNQLKDQLSIETGIIVNGTLDTSRKDCEIMVKNYTLFNKPKLNLSPQPRSNVDVFNEDLSNQIFSNYHIYLRNPKIIALMQFRSELKRLARKWFEDREYVEFDAPILTPAPLYTSDTALGIEVQDNDLFLTQCAGFYLEAAAQGLDKVYNLGPSFRGENSRSRRHLIEYWHIKAELLFGDRERIINVVEEFVSDITKSCLNNSICQNSAKVLETEICDHGIPKGFPRISYREAIELLNQNKIDAEFGKSISNEGEAFISKHFSNSPYWIVGISREVEPFPYVVDKNDTEVTMVADLITSNNCGELVGVAEKIWNPVDLHERLVNKGKDDDPRYQFVRDVHDAGCVPHIAFGMGLERLMRWLLNLPHVKFAIPFPRTVGRKIYP